MTDNPQRDLTIAELDPDLLSTRDWAFVIGTMIFLGSGGLPLYDV